jgi:hypothetical protein
MNYEENGRSLWEMIDWKNLPYVHVHNSSKMSLIDEKSFVLTTLNPILFSLKIILLQNSK